LFQFLVVLLGVSHSEELVVLLVDVQLKRVLVVSEQSVVLVSQISKCSSLHE
jgi:hypothetical protein